MHAFRSFHPSGVLTLAWIVRDYTPRMIIKHLRTQINSRGPKRWHRKLHHFRKYDFEWFESDKKGIPVLRSRRGYQEKTDKHPLSCRSSSLQQPCLSFQMWWASVVKAGRRYEVSTTFCAVLKKYMLPWLEEWFLRIHIARGIQLCSFLHEIQLAACLLPSKCCGRRLHPIIVVFTAWA